MKATVSRGKKQANWQPTFWPEDYVKDGHSMKTQDNRLLETQLSKYGKKVTKYRKIQRDRALAAGDYGQEQTDAYLRNIEKLAKRMHNGYFKKPKEENICK